MVVWKKTERFLWTTTDTDGAKVTLTIEQTKPATLTFKNKLLVFATILFWMVMVPALLGELIAFSTLGLEGTMRQFMLTVLVTVLLVNLLLLLSKATIQTPKLGGFSWDLFK